MRGCVLIGFPSDREEGSPGDGGTAGGRRVYLRERLGRSHRKLLGTDSQMQQVIFEVELS